MEDTAAVAGGKAEGESGVGGEVASVVVDSRVAGWFGLVVDDEDVMDSDEDEEDENRESAEQNDYPEEMSESDEDGSDDEDERGREEERMVAGAEDEEFYRLRQELKRSKNELIAQSDDEDEDRDDGDYDDDDEDEGEEDDYARSHRQYRGGHYDDEI